MQERQRGATIRRQYRTKPILRGAKISSFLLGVLLATILTSGFISRPTAAESFLSQVACRIETLLTIQCKTATRTQPTPQQTTKPSSLTTDSESESAQPSGSNPTKPQQPVAETTLTSSFTPIKMPDGQLPPIAPISEVKTNHLSIAQGAVSYQSPMIRNAVVDGASVLGASSPTFARPSPVGWVIFGTAWYWWLALIVLVGGLGIFTIKGIKQLGRIHYNS